MSAYIIEELKPDDYFIYVMTAKKNFTQRPLTYGNLDI